MHARPIIASLLVERHPRACAGISDASVLEMGRAALCVPRERLDPSLLSQARGARGGMIAQNVQPTLELHRDCGASTSVAEQW